jgi:hypothetical protein
MTSVTLGAGDAALVRLCLAVVYHGIKNDDTVGVASVLSALQTAGVDGTAYPFSAATPARLLELIEVFGERLQSGDGPARGPAGPGRADAELRPG